MGDVQVRNLVFRAGCENLLSQRMKLSRLRRLGHMVRMVTTNLPHCLVFLSSDRRVEDSNL